MSLGREHWNTRIGLILAMAGNAIGLGNFLRFPVQAAENGGGAFMIPYFISFIVLGIPLMWVEWGMGRYGGSRGHGTAPAIFDAIWKHRAAKYVGLLGIFLPLVILMYYVYICSWTLAFSFASILGLYPVPGAGVSQNTPLEYLKPYQDYLYDFIGASGGGLFHNPDHFAYLFFFITLGLGMWILARGVSGGIEKLNKIAIPALFIMAAVLFIRVLTTDSPTDPTHTLSKSLAFLWEPDLSGLTKPRVWLAAAGQVFFTLSLGFGAILTYASYIKKDADIALDGLATSSINEFAEVVFGATIAIISAVIFFGPEGAEVIAGQGAFKLGFISMPAIFSHMPAGSFFGFLWFLLLFIAGLTSIVALSQPAIAFFEDELGWLRKKAVAVIGLLLLFSSALPVFLPGSLDEMDFWAGTFGIVILALVEIIIFFWIFGADNAWKEITRGARIRIPRIFYYFMKYLTPLLLIVILIAWGWQMLPGVLAKSGMGIWTTRIFLIVLLIAHALVIRYAWQRKRRRER